jgi:hypothetical protein
MSAFLAAIFCILLFSFCREINPNIVHVLIIKLWHLMMLIVDVINGMITILFMILLSICIAELMYPFVMILFILACKCMILLSVVIIMYMNIVNAIISSWRL